jgi:hypothetical protein
VRSYRQIVCDNCHLANKLVDIEVPQAILSDNVFEAMKQVLAGGFECERFKTTSQQ